MKKYIKDEYKLGEFYKIIIKDEWKFKIHVSEIRGTTKKNAYAMLKKKVSES